VIECERFELKAENATTGKIRKKGEKPVSRLKAKSG
jgi:hypothetical protein